LVAILKTLMVAPRSSRHRFDLFFGFFQG
jgi:hypothetical protein